MLVLVVWRKYFASAQTYAERLQLAHSFRDVMAMASHMSNAEFNRMLTHQLPDNDRIVLVNAVDVLVSAVLKLQPGSGMLKRRIIPGQPYTVVSNQLLDKMCEDRGLTDAPALTERVLLQRVTTHMSRLLPKSKKRSTLDEL